METTIIGVSLIAVVIGLVQVLKKFVPKNLQPVLALAIGVGISLLTAWDFGVEYILTGIALGLLSMGSYDVVKPHYEKVVGLIKAKRNA